MLKTNKYKKSVVKMKLKIDFFTENLVQAIGAGVYVVSVHMNGDSHFLYVGESVFALVRCAGHLYELKKRPYYFGFTDISINDPGITLKFDLVEAEDSKMLRKKIEHDLINKHKPLCQSGVGDRQKSIEEKILALKEFINRE